MLDRARADEQKMGDVQDNAENASLIKVIEGSTDILLIAPHACIRDGEAKNDENTGFIAEMVANHIGCSAIINTLFHKPDKKKYPKGYKPEKDEYPRGLEYNNLNLNLIDDAKPELVPDYLDAIRAVIDAPGKTLVIWIHGADDMNAVEVAKEGKYDYQPDEIEAFIGYGQGKDPDTGEGESNYTAEQATVEGFRDALIENGMKAVKTDENATNYRGRSEKRMNQWFLKNKYTREQVESIQLEICKAGFRDLFENIEKTANLLIDALNQEAMLPAIQAETKPDEHLVAVAYNHLQVIFAKHFHDAMLQAGRYLVRTFYGTYENARNKKKIRKQSFNRLNEELNDGLGKVPKKTWIYDAVKLAVDEHFLKEFRTYGKLGHSHKVLLLRVADVKKKKDLVEEVINKGFTVERLRQRLTDKDCRPKKKSGEDRLPALLCDKVPANETLEQYKTKQLKACRERLDWRINEYQEKLAQYTMDKVRVEGVIEKKPKDKRKPQKVGFQDWTLPSCNVNIQTGCSNACRYCYAKTLAYKREQVALGSWANQFIRKHDVDKKRHLYHGLVGFPSTHDITPENVDDYLYVLGKLLRAGNEVLIVSKPRFECIRHICEASPFFKDKILFRFTVGAMNDEILGFWEPDAPRYAERKEALEYAYGNGFRTSVSMEPLLDNANVENLVKELLPFITEDLWIGKMNHIDEFGENSDEVLKQHLTQIQEEQTPERLEILHKVFEGKQKVKWKTGS